MTNTVFNFLFTLVYPKKRSPVRETGSIARQYYCKSFVLFEENVSRQPNYLDDIVHDDPTWYGGRSIDKRLLRSDYHVRRQ